MRKEDKTINIQLTISADSTCATVVITCKEEMTVQDIAEALEAYVANEVEEVDSLN